MSILLEFSINLWYNKHIEVVCVWSIVTYKDRILNLRDIYWDKGCKKFLFAAENGKIDYEKFETVIDAFLMYPVFAETMVHKRLQLLS